MTIQAALDGMDRHVNTSVIRLASLIHSEVSIRTPVDTGWARANWIPSIGVPADLDGRRPPVVSRAGGKSILSAVGQAKLASRMGKSQKGLIEIVSRYKYYIGIPIHISNFVPYVPILDRSHKRARGFINRGIERALARFLR